MRVLHICNILFLSVTLRVIHKVKH